MAKVKNKGKKSSIAKKTEIKKKLNPFEVHINKEKLKVLNRKQKHVRGVPGVSRSKAISKRKNTLLEEYKVHKKSNKFMDMRIGEKNPNMSEESKVLARYTAEKVKSHKKKSIFNLADDEVLTHRGQLLTEIEKFENMASDDDEEENNLEADFVKEAHFGGGLLQKVSSDGAKSHKDLINQLILESKKRKHERMKMKEQTLELTEKLDTEWKDLLPLISASKKKQEENQEAAKPKNDDYDKVMREMKFDVRGNPSDRLKPEEEIKKKEQEELAKFEKERQERMKGADDLEDNFLFEDVNDEENNEENEEKNDEEGAESETLEQSEDEEDGEEEKSNEKESSVSDLSEADDEASENSIEENETKEGESDDDDNISLSDLKADESESSESEEEDEKEAASENKNVQTSKSSEATNKESETLSIEVKYPVDYSDFEGMVEYMKAEKLGMFLSKLIQIISGNKEKTNTLFTYILQYVDSSLCTFKKLGYMLPQIFELAKVDSEKSYAAVREYIIDKQNDYRNKPKKYASFSLLLVFKTISALYPTSDFRHGVITPAVIFISQMLTCCRVKTSRDISYGLFLVTLILEYTALSKRFLPAAVSFLTGIIHMAIPKSGPSLLKISPPFKPTSTHLVLEQNMVDYTNDDLILQESDLRNVSTITPRFQISALHLAVKLLTDMVENLKDLSSRCELFEQTYRFLKLLPLENYPNRVKDDADTLKNMLKANLTDRTLNYLTAPKKKPKLLRLYEPNIQKIYDGKKHKTKSREKMEQDKLMHKLKRETKGAMREIRRDKAFLGRVQIKQRLQSDVERKEKVKRIYSEAASQQAELNSLDRKRKKR